jgi:hypothetical protein
MPANITSRLLSFAVLLGAACAAAAQAAPPAHPVPAAQSAPKPGAPDMPDRTVYAPAGYAIGEVAGIVLDSEDRITHVVIRHDVDTGLEVRLTCVPWDVLIASRRGHRIVLDEQRLGSSPAITEAELNSGTHAWRARTDRHWRTPAG